MNAIVCATWAMHGAVIDDAHTKLVRVYRPTELSSTGSFRKWRESGTRSRFFVSVEVRKCAGKRIGMREIGRLVMPGRLCAMAVLCRVLNFRAGKKNEIVNLSE